MTKKADIVELKGSKVQRLGFVDKIFTRKGEELAFVTWFHSSGPRNFLPTQRLTTLRSSEEARQRGRKKIIPGLEESSGVDTRLVRIDEDP
jgi:hypothetical protein